MTSTPHDQSAQGGAGAARPEGAAPQGPGSGTHADDLIAHLRAETADLKDKLLRAHAEVENIRKRAEREKEETAKYAVTRFARDIINVGDNFQRAIDAVPAGAAEQDTALKSFLEGVTMTERELLNVLERYGIKRIHPINERPIPTSIRLSWRSSAPMCPPAPSCRCSRPASPSRTACCGRRWWPSPRAAPGPHRPPRPPAAHHPRPTKPPAGLKHWMRTAQTPSMITSSVFSGSSTPGSLW